MAFLGNEASVWNIDIPGVSKLHDSKDNSWYDLELRLVFVKTGRLGETHKSHKTVIFLEHHINEV